MLLQKKPIMPAGELKPFAPPCLPIVHSTIAIGMPTTKNEITYASINAAPPYIATCPGNFRKFPSPTALPATAKITPMREFQFSLFKVRPP